MLFHFEKIAGKKVSLIGRAAHLQHNCDVFWAAFSPAVLHIQTTHKCIFQLKSSVLLYVFDSLILSPYHIIYNENVSMYGYGEHSQILFAIKRNGVGFWNMSGFFSSLVKLIYSFFFSSSDRIMKQSY